jgi:hypothetical protein
MNFPLISISLDTAYCKQLKIRHLDYIAFGILTAPPLAVRIALYILGTLPESGKLALLGLSLIITALLLRKIMVRDQPALNSSVKAGGQAK